jgi:hypothetical protein
VAVRAAQLVVFSAGNSHAFAGGDSGAHCSLLAIFFSRRRLSTSV